jgi:hypothetical protein
MFSPIVTWWSVRIRRHRFRRKRSFSQIKFASFIALWDIGAQSMVYAGQ